jgi:hypothetical protein
VIKFKNDEMGRACSTHGTDENCIQILVGKPEGRRVVGRSIKTDFE